MAIRRSTDGSAAEYSSATVSLVRSTASVYWIRSLVPIEKKSTSFARWSAIRAAAGTSTMMPTGRFSRIACPSAASSAATSSRTARACRNSSRVETQGEQDPDVAQGAGPEDRPELGPEQARVAEREPQAAQAEARVGLDVARSAVRRQLVGTQVERPDDDRAPLQRADHGGVGLELLLLGRGRLGVEEEELGAEQPDAHGSPGPGRPRPRR